MNIQPTFIQLLAVYASCAVFGLIFNLAISTFERHGWIEGYTWLAVVVGVAITLSAVALIDWTYALITFGAFCCSGFPMAAGSILRHVRSRERSQKAMIDEVTGE